MKIIKIFVCAACPEGVSRTGYIFKKIKNFDAGTQRTSVQQNYIIYK